MLEFNYTLNLLINVLIHWNSIRLCNLAFSAQLQHYNFLQTWNQYVTDYEERFKILMNERNNTQPYIENAAYMFDAIWAAALALNKTKSRLLKENLTFKHFKYEDEYNISGIIYEELLKVRFFGLTVSMIICIICIHMYRCSYELKCNVNNTCMCDTCIVISYI